MRKLTIGMCTYDDFDGVYFTIQSIRMYHPEVLDDIEFVIVDNNPDDKHGKAIEHFIKTVQEPIQYIPFTDYTSTSLRNIIFDVSNTPYILCVDCHVMLEAGSIKKLIDFYDTTDGGDLYHGPLLYDNLNHISTHFDLVWGSHMWGKWGTDDRGKDKNGEPFEIPAQGCGLFTCRRDNWLRFNSNFRGFGGEEGYIHEKYRQHGKKVLCLPFLRWVHRFGRPNGAPYRNTYEDRYRNYLIGWLELGLDTDEVEDKFSDVLHEDIRERIKDEIVILYNGSSKSKCKCGR